MKGIKIVANHNIFGISYQIFTKGKVYKAWQAYPDDDGYGINGNLWIICHDNPSHSNEISTYTWEFIIHHFEMIDERRDRQINSILEKI